jgi:transcriptional regulator with XRE-family HTH domain
MADTTGLLERARHDAGLSQDELARRAGTSRPTLSAYENGRKSPSLSTAQRLLTHAGAVLTFEPMIEFRDVPGRRRSIPVPNVLPRLPLAQAIGTVTLSLTVNWSDPGRVFRLADRADRARLYEIVLREGTPTDILAYIDGALLVDLWPDLALPRDARAAWASVVEPWRAGAASMTEPA